jgi:pimeloyl-ACP methyl ester carboxylesterase
MHVLDFAGAGQETVVLLHGFASASVHFLPLIRRLRPRVARVLVPDLPAHGLSEVPPGGLNPASVQAGLFEALDAVLPSPAIFYGNSMGGLAAVRYALGRPARVRALMLCSPSGAQQSAEQLAALVDDFRVTSHAQALRFVERVFGRRPLLSHALAAGVRQRFNDPNLRGLLSGLTTNDLLTPDELHSLSMPLSLVWGAADGVLPAAQRDFFVHHLPAHARIEQPLAFGHSPYLDRPDEVVAQVDTFLSTLSRRATPSTWTSGRG